MFMGCNKYLGIIEYIAGKERFEARHPGGLKYDTVETDTAGIQLGLQGGQLVSLLVDKTGTTMSECDFIF